MVVGKSLGWPLSFSSVLPLSLWVECDINPVVMLNGTVDFKKGRCPNAPDPV